MEGRRQSNREIGSQQSLVFESYARTNPPSAGIIAIPARLASTRLPNKLLLAQTGRPLLAHVIDRALDAVRASRGLLTQVVVACDHESLISVARQCGVRAVMTGEHHRCGTTRIAEAIEKLTLDRQIDFVVNVQGDEPELAPQAILRVAEVLLNDPAAEMSTLVIAMPPGTEAKKANPNAVKAVIDAQGRALYFSRAPVPYDRNPPTGDEPLWHHHLGIYAYRREFLLHFANLPPCPLEEREGLEQLRALNAGKTIQVGVIPEAWAGKGIDTADDYAAFVRRCA
jgi:3-deoxy-manno-octulosonate cytidylyltransferase (CMP-KDO synthetase)